MRALRGLTSCVAALVLGAACNAPTDGIAVQVRNDCDKPIMADTMDYPYNFKVRLQRLEPGEVKHLSTTGSSPDTVRLFVGQADDSGDYSAHDIAVSNQTIVDDETVEITVSGALCDG